MRVGFLSIVLTALLAVPAAGQHGAGGWSSQPGAPNAKGIPTYTVYGTYGGYGSYRSNYVVRGFQATYQNYYGRFLQNSRATAGYLKRKHEQEFYDQEFKHILGTLLPKYFEPKESFAGVGLSVLLAAGDAGTLTGYEVPHSAKNIVNRFARILIIAEIQDAVFTDLDNWANQLPVTMLLNRVIMDEIRSGWDLRVEGLTHRRRENIGRRYSCLTIPSTCRKVRWVEIK